MTDNITHCVIMVTYNHEKYIKTALDSIFNNKIIPNKVIICDDHSIDNTWEIIQEYKSLYPNIIDCYQNPINLGIFQNINKAYKLGLESNCDIITDLAGDDYLKTGLFEELNKVVISNKIDVKNDKFIIITNTEELYPDGHIRIINNYNLRDVKDLIYYRITMQLSYREIGLSRNVLLGIEPYRTDLGVWADLLFCLDYETNCDNFYFTPFVSTGYRIGVGTVSKQKQCELQKSRYEVEKIVLKRYNLSYKTKKYIKNSINEYELANAIFEFKQKKSRVFPLILFIKVNGLRTTIKKILSKLINSGECNENTL